MTAQVQSTSILFVLIQPTSIRFALCAVRQLRVQLGSNLIIKNTVGLHSIRVETSQRFRRRAVLIMSLVTDYLCLCCTAGQC